MSSVEQLNKEAQAKVPQVQSQKHIKQYFQLGASYLKMAGTCKKSGDFSGAYLNLKKYIVLVTERLPKHPQSRDPQFAAEYKFNANKATAMGAELVKLSQQIEPPKKSFWGSWFGGKKEETQKKPNLPPVPRSNNQQHSTQLSTRNDDVSTLSMSEKATYHAVGKLAYNDRVQEEVGKGIARIALNDKVQGRVADGVAAASLNRGYQKAVGKALAENTDNEMIKKLASNAQVQQAVGVTLAKTVGNKELQRKTGRAIAKAATDKRVQRAGAKIFMSGLKLGIKGTKAGIKGGVALGQLAYEEKMKQDRLAREQNK